MKWVLVDLSCIAYRVNHSLKDLSFEDMPTGVIYGVLDQLLSLSKNRHIKSNRILIFGDSRKSFRKEVYKEYKAKRKDYLSEEEIEQIRIMHEQINILGASILPRIGFPCYRQTGLESDDLIAMTAKQLDGTNQDTVIITSDGDLYQCITENVYWYDPIRNKYVGKEEFYDEKGIWPNQWAVVKSLAGCPTDNVPGVPGIGEKTAIAYLKSELPKGKKLTDIESSVWDKSFYKWESLVKLPHKKTKPIKIKKPEYSPAKFFDICKTYGLDSFLEGRKQEWLKFFGKDIIKGRKRK